MRRAVLTLCLFLAPVMVADAGSLMKCKDRNGNLLFTDDPPRGAVCEGMAGYTPSRDVPATKIVPPRTASPATTAAPASTTADRETSTHEKTPPVVEIYVTSWCGWSKKAIEFFTSRGIAFSAYDIEKDPEANRRHDELSP